MRTIEKIKTVNIEGEWGDLKTKQVSLIYIWEWLFDEHFPFLNGKLPASTIINLYGVPTVWLFSGLIFNKRYL